MVAEAPPPASNPAEAGSSSFDDEFEPVDKETLGRSTWTFLHTLAATYSSAPSEKEASRASRFMRDFSVLYPCAPCARSFQKIVARRPPDEAARSGGLAFAKWMCEVHNDVNEELGKDRFDCSEKSLTARWGECESCAAHADELDSFMKLTGFGGQPR